MPHHILKPPHWLKRGTVQVRIGGTVWIALLALHRAHGSLSTAKLCKCVWECDCQRGRIKSLVQRVNVALAAVGSTRRCEVDGERVRLSG
jgi:hypothetical protein